jgi:hypothetical protein
MSLRENCAGFSFGRRKIGAPGGESVVEDGRISVDCGTIISYRWMEVNSALGTSRMPQQRYQLGGAVWLFSVRVWTKWYIHICTCRYVFPLLSLFTTPVSTSCSFLDLFRCERWSVHGSCVSGFNLSENHSERVKDLDVFWRTYCS